MKKTVSSILLASALLLGAIAPVTANAAAIDPSTGTTTGTVTFTKPASTTTPVDPTDPTQPGGGGDDNGGATHPGDDADLTFLYVSPTMDFGSHVADQTTNSTAKTYNPTSIESTVFKADDKPTSPKLVTEVSDTRGTNVGWNVTVGSSALAAGSDTIANAQLNLGGDQATITNSANSNAKGQAANLVAGGDAATIYNATEGTGAGASAMQLDASNIVLTNIPANVKATEAGTAYTATLNWTLNNTPAK